MGFLHIALRSVVVCLSVDNIPVTILQMQKGQQITQDRSQTNAISVTLRRLCHHHHSDHVINSLISIRHCPSLIPTADTNQCQWLRSGGQLSDIPPVNIIGYPTGDHGGTLCIDSVTTQALEVYAKVWCVETAPMSVYLVFGLNRPA